MKEPTTIAAAAGGAAAVASPLIGPPLLTGPVIAGALLGSIIALLFFFRDEIEITIKTLIEACLIFVTGVASAIFGASTVAHILEVKFGVMGDGVGLIALVLAFQGKQLFMIASNIKSILTKSYGNH